MDQFIRNAQDQALVDWVAGLAARLAENSAAYDDGGRFVDGQIRLLHKAGYSALTAPAEYGGRGASLYELLLAQERLAQGDAAAALVMGWHLGITQSLRDTQAWPDELYRAFCEQCAAQGALVNSCATEPETGSPSRGGRPSTVATKADGGFVLRGHKTWATGSPMLTHIIVTAFVPELDRVGEFLILQGAPGLVLSESWDSMSMRGTGSHTFELRDVFVPDERALDFVAPGQKMRRSSDGGGWLLHIPATYLGVANVARRYALQFAASHSPSSMQGKPISTIAQVREKLGRIEVLRDTARTLLYTTAARYDAAPTREQRQGMRAELGLAKYAATNAAVDMVDLAMRVVGGNSLLRSTPLERAYRDVRAGLHNPPMDDVTLNILAERALASVAPEE